MIRRRVAAWACAALVCGLGLRLSSQGFSFAAPFPAITKHAASGLQVDYAAGKLAVGGLLQSILAGNVTVANTQTSCEAPTYPSCNFIYWPGVGTALSTSTDYATAFASGNVVVAFVTSTGGNIVAVTPVSVNPPNAQGIGSYWVSPGQGASYASANTTGTNGLTLIGTANTQVQQVQTSTVGTNTHTYVYNISPPVRPSQIISATFFYGTQATVPLGTQAAVLASGTMNGTIVFTSITYPAPATSETASPVTPIRADTGSLTITPTVANFVISTVDAGTFYSVKFTPSSPIAVTSDLVQVFLNVTIQMQFSSAMITNSPGALVRYTTR